MTDWESLTGPHGNGDTSDFVSLYMSESSCSSVRAHVNELSFAPSPSKPSSATSSLSHQSLHHHPSTTAGAPPAEMMSSIGGLMMPNGTSTNGSSSTPFCDGGNMQQCLKFLNQEVTTLGLPSLYEGGSASTVRLINCCYEFLQKYQRSARLREDIEDRLQRSIVDGEAQQVSSGRLRAALEQQERDTAAMTERERQVKHKNKLLNSKLKAEKEEVKRLQSVIQHRDAQYKHDQKKKEREQIKLKERLHQLLADKTDRRIGMEIANNLQRIGGKRGKWATNNRQEEELYRGVISTYEEKQKQLMVENHELRQSLTHLQHELVTMLHSPAKQNEISTRTSIDEEEEEEANQENDSTNSKQLSEGVFQMPYELVRDTVEQNLREQCVMLRQYIHRMQKQMLSTESNGGVEGTSNCVSGQGQPQGTSARTGPTEKEEQQRTEIERLLEIIDQQEEMMQAQFDTTAAASAYERGSALNESALWEDKAQLERDQQHFQQQHQHFQRERSSFTEAAIRLSQDRKTFEEEKAAFLSQQFNSLTPFRDEGGRRRPVSAAAGLMPSTGQHKRNRQLPSTPSHMIYRPFSTPISDATKRVVTPSTSELYRQLGLQHLEAAECTALAQYSFSDQ